MAMHAGQVAELAHIELEDLGPSPPQLLTGSRDRLVEVVLAEGRKHGAAGKQQREGFREPDTVLDEGKPFKTDRRESSAGFPLHDPPDVP